MITKRSSKARILFLVALAAVFLFAIVGVSWSTAYAQGNLLAAPTQGTSLPKTTGFSWELTLDYANSPDTVASTSARLTSLGVTNKSETLADGSHRLILDGGGNIELVRQIIYDTLLPDYNFLNGSGIISILTTTTSGSPIKVSLESQPGTGYTWGLNSPETSPFTVQGQPTLTSRSQVPGSTSLETLVVQPSSTGPSTLELIYQQPFDKSAAVTRHLTITLSGPVSSIDLSDPNPPQTGIIQSPADQLSGIASILQPEINSSGFPASYDWRSSGDVSAIRNQGSCGSCWAFALTAVMESALRIHQNTAVDLSEQFLVSCNVAAHNALCGNKYSCAGGCEDAQQYDVNTLAQGQTAAGAVLESQFPYTQSDAACKAGLTHSYKAASWNFVGGVWNYNPTVAQIKTAITTYGPVTSTVCVGSAFDGYSGGVFSTDEGTCQNHMISLVGWDDSTQTWILRNSWGTGWGDNGYMHIKWGTSGVGFRVSYVTMSDQVNPPVPIAPSGTISDTKPTFTWSKITGATQYSFSVYQGSSLNYSKTVAASACGSSADNCSNTPTTALSYADHTWKVRAFVGGIWKTYSASKTFTITNIPAPLSPSGTISDTTPTFTWKRISGATQYNYILYKGSATVYNKTVASSACGSSSVNCSNTPTTVLSAGAYNWKVRAYVGGMWRSFSSSKSFTVTILSGFDSEFTSNASGWSPLKASWSLGSGYYQTLGVSGAVASSIHTSTYSTITYQVRFRRTGCSSCASIIYFRGNPSPLDSYGTWYNGYRLSVSNDGEFNVGYYKNGVWYFLVPWTTSSAVTSSWNTLKVTMNGNFIQLFINGTRVAWGTVNVFSSGRVGIAVFNDSSTGNHLYVDWAKLSLTAPTGDATDPTSPDLGQGGIMMSGPLSLTGDPNVAP